MTKKIIIAVFSFFLIYSCKEKTVNSPQIKFFKFQSSGLSGSGFLLNEVENGIWKYYDSTNKIIKQGKFVKGIQNGKWQYNLYGRNVNLNWKYHYELFPTIKFSIPNNFNLYTHSDTLIQFKSDSSLFSLFIFRNQILNLQQKTGQKVKPHFLDVLNFQIL